MKRKYDAILLLGLRLNDDGSAQDEMILRSRKAAELYSAGLAPVIVACGGKTGASGRTEAEVLREELVELGVPYANVILEDKSLITNENIINARAILGEDKRRAALVTSDYHVFRSRLICLRAGFRAKGFPARTPKDALKKDKRKLEALFTVDYLMGWQSGARPRWAGALMRRIAEPIFKRLRAARENKQ